MHDADEQEGTGRLIASKRQSLMKADLRHIAEPEELAEAEKLAANLAKAMRYRLSRRYRMASKGPRIDLRRTSRRNIPHGGDPIELVRRKRPDKPVRIVVLLDVSGSMKQYSRFFLQFVKGLVSTWVETDAYLFHTRLVRVTEAMRDKDPIKAMSRLALMTQGFGGGTEIARSLRHFNDRYAKAALNSRSVVMILSDGYDTGDASGVAREMKRLRRKARRIVWLNPLIGWRDYQPVAKAMAEALPHVDCFAAAHSLEALGKNGRRIRPALIRHDLALIRKKKMSKTVSEILTLANELSAKGSDYCVVTVVRTANATSAKAGAKALVTADGALHGFVGGGCVKGAVTRSALAALGEGNARLIRVKPKEDVVASVDTDGVELHKSSCPSGGTVDLFLEPMRQAMQVVICGASPVAMTLIGLAKTMGYRVTVAALAEDHASLAGADTYIDGFDMTSANVRDCDAIVIATQGKRDREAMTAAALNTRLLPRHGRQSAEDRQAPRSAHRKGPRPAPGRAPPRPGRTRYLGHRPGRNRPFHPRRDHPRQTRKGCEGGTGG